MAGEAGTGVAAVTAVILDEEAVQWRCAANDPPDSDTTVLVYMPNGEEPVWLGFRDAEGWVSIDGVAFLEGAVTAWAPMPRGTSAHQSEAK